MRRLEGDDPSFSDAEILKAEFERRSVERSAKKSRASDLSLREAIARVRGISEDTVSGRTPGDRCAGNPAPVYPPMLRSANVEGEVLAQFVVDTLGRVDTTTLHILRSTHDLFSSAVKASLAEMRFTPAEVGAER